MPAVNSDESDQEEDKSDTQVIPARKIVFTTVRLAVPMALSFTFSISQVLTAILITHIPTDYTEEDLLAISTLVTSVTNVVPVIAVSPLFSTGIMGSKYYGELETEEDPEQIESLQCDVADTFKAGMTLSTLIMPAPFLTLFYSKYVLVVWFGQNEEVAEDAQQFLRPYAFAMPAYMYRVCSEQMMFAYKRINQAMGISLTSLAVGTGLACYLTFGPPKMGLAGIAYGYVTESYLTWLGYSLDLACHKKYKGVPFFDLRRNKSISQQMKEMLRIGLPMAFQMTCEFGAFLVIGVLAGLIGKEELAAQDFASQLFFFAVVPSFAFSQTVAQEVSTLIGKKDFKNAMRFSRYGFLTATGLISAICVPISIWPKGLTSVLAVSVKESTMNKAKKIIPLAAVQTILDTTCNATTQTLRSTNDLYVPTIIKTACLWIGILAAFLIGVKQDHGLTGIQLCLLSGIAAAAIALLGRFIDGTKAKNIRNNSTLPSMSLYEKCYACFYRKGPSNATDTTAEDFVNDRATAVASPLLPLVHSRSDLQYVPG